MTRISLIAIIAVFIASHAWAQPALFGEWSVDTSDEGNVIFAATANDSGGIFGQYCAIETGDCMFMLGINTSCESGNSYPTLLNSDKTTSVHEVVCDTYMKKSKAYRYIFTDFNLLERSLKDTSRIGFAIPLQDNQFKVVRFTTKDFQKAVSFMQARLSVLNEKREKGTKDKYL